MTRLPRPLGGRAFARFASFASPHSGVVFAGLARPELVEGSWGLPRA